MWDVPALQHFLRDELLRRNWSIEEFARRAQISTSNGYLIIRDGKDNVRTDTFDNIAFAVNMTPAELMTAIGKGARMSDAKREPIHAIVRDVPDEDLGVIDRVLRSFVKSHSANRRRQPGANRNLAAAHDFAADQRDQGEDGVRATLTDRSHWPGLSGLLPPRPRLAPASR